MSEGPHPPITARTLALWAAPPALALVMLAVTFWRGWEPWFGYACLIGGGIGTLMLVGRHYRIGE